MNPIMSWADKYSEKCVEIAHFKQVFKDDGNVELSKDAMIIKCYIKKFVQMGVHIYNPDMEYIIPYDFIKEITQMDEVDSILFKLRNNL